MDFGTDRSAPPNPNPLWDQDVPAPTSTIHDASALPLVFKTKPKYSKYHNPSCGLQSCGSAGFVKIC